QLLLLDNADASRAVAAGLKVTAAGGKITNGIDLSDTDIDNALSIADNDIAGTNFNLTGSTGLITLGASAQSGSIVLYDNGAGSETVTLSTTDITGSYSLNLPAAVGSTNQCLMTDASVATQ